MTVGRWAGAEELAFGREHAPSRTLARQLTTERIRWPRTRVSASRDQTPAARVRVRRNRGASARRSPLSRRREGERRPPWSTPWPRTNRRRPLGLYRRSVPQAGRARARARETTHR